MATQRTRSVIFKEMRERMTNRDYSTIQKLRSIKNVDRVVMLGGKRLTGDEIYAYYEKVSDIQRSDNLCLKAIGCLIDHAVFDKLDESAKQRYVLDLSSFYLSLKEEYLTKEHS